jgi:hypothetical protein
MNTHRNDSVLYVTGQTHAALTNGSQTLGLNTSTFFLFSHYMSIVCLLQAQFAKASLWDTKQWNIIYMEHL